MGTSGSALDATEGHKPFRGQHDRVAQQKQHPRTHQNQLPGSRTRPEVVVALPGAMVGLGDHHRAKIRTGSVAAGSVATSAAANAPLADRRNSGRLDPDGGSRISPKARAAVDRLKCPEPRFIAQYRTSFPHQSEPPPLTPAQAAHVRQPCRATFRQLQGEIASRTANA